MKKQSSQMVFDFFDIGSSCSLLVIDGGNQKSPQTCYEQSGEARNEIVFGAGWMTRSYSCHD